MDRGAWYGFAMAHLVGTDRSQLLLLPEAVDDYVGPDNPVRFIEAFVDGLDLGAAGFVRVQPKTTGRPGYDPADLLKIYIYGYLNRIRSSRRLEAEAHRNIEAIWLLRHLKPDFKTIADFRRDNRAAFKAVFREFVVLCRQLDLFGRELVAVDGTRIKAVNNKTRNFTRASLAKFIQDADEKLAGYMKRLDEGDADDDRTPGGSSGQRAGKVKHKLIAEQAVSNQVLDPGLLAQTATAAMEALGVERIDAVADRGYFKIEDIEACEAAGITAYVAKPLRGSAVREGFFGKEVFRYEPDRDVFICPAGAVLSPRYRGKSRDNVKVDYANRDACAACAMKSRCTRSFRRVSRLENEAVLDRMAARLAARPDVLDHRRNSVEHPFGTIKQWMGQGAFLMRRLENVRGEFSLTALAYNIRRAITLVGVPGLIAAARA